MFAKAGYLTVQRQTDVPWQDFAILPQVALTPLDEAVTTIDLASPNPIQVARVGVETDGDGSRQATLLFPQGVQATMTLPDGSVRTLTSLDVRATEYTVGGMGPAAMPGTLPAASGYTYAVELSVDQAMRAGATRVDFSQAVPFYVENFLDFPVGMAVPAGYYDRVRGLWVPDDNGRVIQVLSVAGGVAEVDADGDGDADTAAELAALGVTVAEQERLAALYAAGQSLWRVPVTHFTPWDYNWPFGPPEGAEAPQTNPDHLRDERLDDQNQECGSIIGVENQTLGEAIPVTGTPFALVYQSDRVPGLATGRGLTIPLTKATLPPGLGRIELTIGVAGRQFKESFAPSANLNTLFTWGGLDAYGQTLRGNQAVTIEIGYVYGLARYQNPAEVERSFGLLSGIPLAANQARQEITLSQHLTTNVFAAYSAIGLAGWFLDALHSYDPMGQTLYLGTGEQRHADKTLNNSINTIAGAGPGGFTGISSGDGGRASQASIQYPEGLAVGPDGSVYLSEGGRIRRVGTDGIITTVAGTGTRGFGGDGGPATEALIGQATSIAVGPDGSLYLAEVVNDRVRRVSPDGMITTVAGNGTSGFSGDGGPATQAQLGSVWGLAVGADSSLYISDDGNRRVRRVSPDGIISTVAGNGAYGFSGDGGPATQAYPSGEKHS